MVAQSQTGSRNEWMGHMLGWPEKRSVCCIQCLQQGECDGLVARAAAQVTELSLDEAQSCRLKVVSEHCCAHLTNS